MSESVRMPVLGLTQLEDELRKMASNFDGYAKAVGTLGIQEIHGHEFSSWSDRLRYAAAWIKAKREADGHD